MVFVPFLTLSQSSNTAIQTCMSAAAASTIDCIQQQLLSDNLSLQDGLQGTHSASIASCSYHVPQGFIDCITLDSHCSDFKFACECQSEQRHTKRHKASVFIDIHCLPMCVRASIATPNEAKQAYALLTTTLPLCTPPGWVDKCHPQSMFSQAKYCQSGSL